MEQRSNYKFVFIRDPAECEPITGFLTYKEMLAEVLQVRINEKLPYHKAAQKVFCKRIKAFPQSILEKEVKEYYDISELNPDDEDCPTVSGRLEDIMIGFERYVGEYIKSIKRN